MAASISEQYHCLIDILTCMVCKEMVTKAHICPNCSKFYCLDCIIRQLAVEESCINCNKYLEVSMLVNCQKLCTELSETLEKVSLKKSQSVRTPHQKLSLHCSKHKLQKTYYCKTCDKPLCSDCSVLTQNHRGHEFIKLSLMRNAFESKIHQKVDEINSLLKNIEKRLELAEVIRQKKGANNQQHLQQFQSSMKLLKQQLRKSLKKILNEGEKSLDRITQNLQTWNNKYQNLMGRLKNCSKGKFVQREFEILEKELIDVLQHIDAENENINSVNIELKDKKSDVSYIHPTYEDFVFIITDYSTKGENQGFFYTNSITTKMGLEWRLKIYPQGLIDQKEKGSNEQNSLLKKQSKNEDFYFAIFLEFVNGYVSTTRQKYELTLVNQAYENRNFTRVFESEFDKGECWGYEHFIKLNLMYQDEYYNRDEDILEVILKICPSNYFQAIKDQEALIKEKQALLHKQQAMIKRAMKYASKGQLSTSSLIEFDTIKANLH